MGAERPACRAPGISLAAELPVPLRHLDRIAQIPAAGWDALFPADYPFIRHAFLHALEAHGCAVPETGWTPRHLVLEGEDGRVQAAAPLYLKSHSWGEFVFDHPWARAAQQAGLAYYPKWLSACPFTPATGPRWGACDATSEARLLDALLQLPSADGAGSWHGLFLQPTAARQAEERGALLRHDIQFHWRNADPPHADFTAFLATLKRDKRRKILQERRRVAEAGLCFERRRGDDFSESEWAVLYALYANTYEERGQPPYLSFDFFLHWAAAPGSPARVIVARDGTRPVAMALCVQGGDTLYGRHWGAAERYNGLHFETCYYQGIEWCLAEQWRCYDAGAQGEHKLARGFDPVLTASAHRLQHPGLRAAVARHLQLESRQRTADLVALQAHSASRVG